jgi:RNA polymerase sigma-70 factor (ECF subfamily)
MGDVDAGLDASFDELYPKVLAFAIRRTPDRQTAEDVAAEAFAIAWNRRDEKIEHPLPWLYGVARKLIANQHRSAGRRARLHHRLAEEGEIEARDASSLVSERDAIRHAFAQLSEREREVLALVAWERVSSAEGAEVLGCSRTAFELQLFRARRKLQKELTAAGHLPDEGPRRPSQPASEKA